MKLDSWSVMIVIYVSHMHDKWINKLASVYDAYFSPSKDEHRYLFGTMLLIRGILLVLLTVTSAANLEMNVLCYPCSKPIYVSSCLSNMSSYKRMTVIMRLLESAMYLTEFDCLEC